MSGHHPLRVGSLCSGYGGLELGASLAFGDLDHRWHAEYDKAPAAVLTARWPGVDNLGDIAAVTARDGWRTLPPIDLVCAGYPCQGESDAGLRRGQDDPRFMWPHVWAAIRGLRPRIVVLENVRGHLNRSFPRVVADLSAIGYVGRWACVPASDAGAAHRRIRLFVVAWPADVGPPRPRSGGVVGMAGRGLTGPMLPTPTATRYGHQGGSAGRVGPVRHSLDRVDVLLPTPRTSDTNGPGQHGDGGMDLRTAVSLLPTPRARDHKGADPNPKGGDLNHAIALLPAAGQPGRWGAYGPAIARWADVVGRPAPEATLAGRKGRPQLSPLFVEWLMGLPGGWVTDVLHKRADALPVLGNGVVPQAAGLAITRLLATPATPAHVQPDLFADAR